MIGWDKNDWWEKNNCLYEGELGCRQEYSCESQVLAVCQYIADSLYEGFGIDAIIIDSSKA
jgi:hypothetical protein